MSQVGVVGGRIVEEVNLKKKRYFCRIFDKMLLVGANEKLTKF